MISVVVLVRHQFPPLYPLVGKTKTSHPFHSTPAAIILSARALACTTFNIWIYLLWKINSLSNDGEIHLKDNGKRIMEKLMTKEVMASFNMKGGKGTSLQCCHRVSRGLQRRRRQTLERLSPYV
ncbi:hypothetical protein F2P79_023626 [Pimephales promelas]|nr:hypothetical protein F2P79_023626 [Pimephales promelas]